MEVLLAVLIVGVGITAATQLFMSSTLQNQASVKMTIATNLANNIQELMSTAAYTDPGGAWFWGLEGGEQLAAGNQNLDVDDFDNARSGAGFNPPVDAGWQPQAQFSQYTQKVSVSTVSHKDFNTVVAHNQDEGVRRVVVTISYKRDAATPARDVYNLVFFRFNDTARAGANEK